MHAQGFYASPLVAWGPHVLKCIELHPPVCSSPRGTDLRTFVGGRTGCKGVAYTAARPSGRCCWLTVERPAAHCILQRRRAVAPRRRAVVVRVFENCEARATRRRDALPRDAAPRVGAARRPDVLEGGWQARLSLTHAVGTHGPRARSRTRSLLLSHSLTL
eukprot:5648801-Pleurochrysis_carterae.AAC.1